MSYYIRYALVNQTVTLPELEEALRTINLQYCIDEDVLLIDDDELGQIDIYLQGSPFFNNDIKLMRRWAAQEPEIANLLDNVVSIVTLMVIWSRSREETLELITPLFEWLASSKIGVLMDEGGRFYVGGSIELAA